MSVKVCKSLPERLLFLVFWLLTRPGAFVYHAMGFDYLESAQPFAFLLCFATFGVYRVVNWLAHRFSRFAWALMWFFPTFSKLLFGINIDHNAYWILFVL